MDLLPWLSTRVPPPTVFVVFGYYAALAVVLFGRGRIRVAAACTSSPLPPIGGVVAAHGSPTGQPRLRLTVFDVGQGEAVLIQPPSAATRCSLTAVALPFGSGGFDIGARVLAPALWARGVRRLHALLVTHGDPDHLGGARSVLGDFAPAQAWEGIPVLRHAPLQAWLADARARGIP